ncbi:MAG: hypothetical protein ABSC04_07440 [Syntrophobacteraceae bacterium]|jgi:hypothetical protein
MSKTLIVALALSLVLFSGSIYTAQAIYTAADDSGCNTCGWDFSLSSCGCFHLPSCFSPCSTCGTDKDRPNLDNPPAPNNNNRDKGQY